MQYACSHWHSEDECRWEEVRASNARLLFAIGSYLRDAPLCLFNSAFYILRSEAWCYESYFYSLLYGMSCLIVND
jgi:hypothetical protein